LATVAAKSDDVVAAISKADTLPSSCKGMLSTMVRSSLTVVAAERHRYQVEAVNMMEQVLVSMQKEMQDAAAESQAKVDNADHEKASRAAAVERAQAALEDLEEKASAIQEAMNEDKASLATAETNLASAVVALEKKEANVISTSQQLSTLETAYREIYEPLKVSKSSGHEGRKAFNNLVKVFSDIGLERGLVELVPETLRKDPAERGTFDNLLVKHVESQTTQYLVDAERAIKDAKDSETNLVNAKTSAEAARTAAGESLSLHSAELEAAVAALKDGKRALKVAQDAVVGFDHEMVTERRNLEDLKAKLARFSEGALQSFADLKELAPPAPEAAEEVSPTPSKMTPTVDASKVQPDAFPLGA